MTRLYKNGDKVQYVGEARPGGCIGTVVVGQEHPSDKIYVHWARTIQGWHDARFLCLAVVPTAQALELDLTKPVQTRNGLPVRILCIDRVSAMDWSVVGLIKKVSEEWLTSWTKAGRHHSSTEHDLVNIPPPKAKCSATLLLRRSTVEDNRYQVSVTPLPIEEIENKKGWEIIAKRAITIEEGEGMGPCK